MFYGVNMIRVDIRLLLMLALVTNGVVEGQRKPVGGGSGGGSAPPPASTDYVDRNSDNSYRFGYNTGDEGSHFHVSSATADNSVTGRFGQREPGTGRLVQTTYTAGQRGFRARGDQVARRMDLSQQRIPYTPPVSPDSPNYQPTYSGYHDPNEDPSFEYSFQTPTFTKKETQDSKAEVTGSYTYVDDVGERHNVQYEAGPRTGFHVKTLYPDSTPYTGLFYRGAPANKQTGPLRGKTSIQRGTDGSYRFTATGPDQRRTEVSDAANNVRGSYTYLDDKGVQRTVQYIAGPNIGYKVIGGNKGLSPAGSSPGGTGQFPYTPPDIETASPTSSAPPQKDSLNPSANLDEELFGPAPSGPLPSGEPEKQQQEIQGDPEDFLNTPLYGASGSASPQYSEPSSTLAPTLSPTPSPSPLPVSQLPQDFDDFLPPLSAFPEDDPSIPKPRPPGGGGGSPSYLTLEDNDFLKTPFALLPVGDSYDNSNYGGQFKRPKSNNNPSVNNNNNDNNQPTPNNNNNRNVPGINSRDRIQTNIGNTNKNNHNNDNNNIYRTPPSAPGRDRPGYNSNNNDNNNNNNYIPSTGRERESYSPPNPPPMRDRDNPPPQPFSPPPPGSGGDNFFNTGPGRDNGFTIPPPSTPKDGGFPLLNFGGDDDDFLPPLPGANDFPVPPAGGRIDYPPPPPPTTPRKDRPNYFEGGRDRDREPSRRPYLHRDHKYSPSQKTFLGIPSGVAVRAHVQSLDILPFGSRIPPPGHVLDYERRRQQPGRRRRR